MQNTLSDDVLLEAIKTALTLIPLIAGWLIGQGFITSWDLRRKKQETYISSTASFQELYGEFKEIGRLWRVVKSPKEGWPAAPDGTRWKLFERATAAESRYEALLIKLATERDLSDLQLRTLGLFRQAVQQVREAIRADRDLPSTQFGSEYHLFNELAVEVAGLIARLDQISMPHSRVAQQNLAQIAAIRSHHWSEAVNQFSPGRVRQ